MRNQLKAKVAIMVVISILLIANFACSSSTSTPNAPSGNQNPQSSAQSDNSSTQLPLPTGILPTATKGQPQKTSSETFLGDTVIEKGYSLTSLNVEDPAKPGMFYTAEAGKRLVAVEITVSNSSGNPMDVNPLLVTLVDTSKQAYTLELGGTDKQIATTTIKPGEKVQGWVAFKIPEGAKLSSIRYTISLLGPILEVGLGIPPAGHVSNTEATAVIPSTTETYLGDTVLWHGYALTPLTVEDPAKPSGFYRTEASKKLVGVEIIISNVSGDSLSCSAVNAVLVDDQGYTYQAELGGMDKQIATLDLTQGERVRGWIAFAIPESAKPVALKYSPELFGDDFKVGILPAPEGYTPASEPAYTPPVISSKLGEAVSKYGYSLTANIIKNPAPAGMFTSIPNGWKMVAIEITIANDTGDKLSVNPLSTYLVDNQGFVYVAELGVDGQLATIDLGHGEKAKGWVGFLIPEESVPMIIKYSLGFYSTEGLAVGLLE